MHSFVPVAVAALAPFAAASAVLPEFVDFSVLIARQEPGTPAYQCHYDCGNVIVGARTDGYCDDSTWQDEFDGCMECALTYNIWQYYGTSVTSAAEACGLSVNPSASGTVASSTAAGSAATTSSSQAEAATTSAAAEQPTSAVEVSSAAVETTASPQETSAAVSTGSESAAVSTSAAEVPSTTSAGSVGTTSAVSSASPTSSLVTVSGASKGQTLALAFGTLASAITAALLM